MRRKSEKDSQFMRNALREFCRRSPDSLEFRPRLNFGVFSVSSKSFRNIPHYPADDI